MTTINIDNNVPFEKQYPITIPTIIVVETQNGSIHVYPSQDQNMTVKAEACHFEQSAKVDIVHHDGQFKFKLLNKSNGSSILINNGCSSSIVINNGCIQYSNKNIQSPQLTIRLYVPSTLLSHIQLITSNGAIEMTQFSDPIDRLCQLTTSNSHVVIDHVYTKTLHVTTSNDFIDVTQCHGQMTLKTSNSHVKAENNNGDIDITTSNDNVHVVGQTGSVYAKTSNAPIYFNNPESTMEQGQTSNDKVTYTNKPTNKNVLRTRQSFNPFDF